MNPALTEADRVVFARSALAAYKVPKRVICRKRLSAKGCGGNYDANW
jgi:hypothetical protein